MLKKKQQPILVRVLKAYQTFFLLETLLTAYIVKQTFLQINLLVPCRYKARPNSATMD